MPAPSGDRYDELCCYTLAHGHRDFIHQHVVDAHAAQMAGASTKSIAITFALAGLFLRVEKGFSGREVQLAHMRMAREKHQWPAFTLPADRGSVTADEVMRAPEGQERDAAIDAWCASVWHAYSPTARETIVALLRKHGVTT